MKHSLETFSVTGPYFQISARFSKIVVDPDTKQEHAVGNFRTTYRPGQNLKKEKAPLTIRKVADVLWTPKIIRDFKKMNERDTDA